MKILVTGGSGFIGTNLVEKLLNLGHDVSNFDIKAPKKYDHLGVWSFVDITNLSLLKQAIQNFSPDVIFHLAARTDLDGSDSADYQANIKGVENIITAISGINTLKIIIFASSRLVCRIGHEPEGEFDYCPDTAYGNSKVSGEKIVRELSHKIRCPWIIVRPTSIWGPWFDVPYKNFFEAVISRKYLHPSDLKIKKSFGYVGNTVHQLISLCGAKGETLHFKTTYLADYDSIDLKNMANVISHSSGLGEVLSVPLPLLKLIAKLGDILKKFGYKNPPLTTFRLNNLITPMEYDLFSLKSAVGPLPFTMSMGVELTCKWLVEEGTKRQ